MKYIFHKTIFSLLILLAMIQIVSANTIYYNDFDSYSEGDYPSDWINIFDGYDASISSEESYSADNSFQFIGESGWARVDVIDIGSVPDIIAYEGYMLLNSSLNDRRMDIGFMGSSGGEVLHYDYVSFGAGNIYWRGNEAMVNSTWEAIGTFVPNVWYKVRVVADLVNETADIYINDALAKSGAKTKPKIFEYENQTLGHNLIGISTDNFKDNGLNTVYLDNIMVEEVTDLYLPETEQPTIIETEIPTETETIVPVTPATATTTISKSEIEIKSTPSGADIYVDNKYIGISPITYKVDSGTHKVMARMSGYADASETITIGIGQNALVSLSLGEASKQSSPGFLSVIAIIATGLCAFVLLYRKH